MNKYIRLLITVNFFSGMLIALDSGSGGVRGGKWSNLTLIPSKRSLASSTSADVKKSEDAVLEAPGTVVETKPAVTEVSPIPVAETKADNLSGESQADKVETASVVESAS